MHALRPASPGSDRRHEPGPEGEEPPPVLGRWSVLYAVIAGELLLVILLCHWLSGWGR